jgi:DTW domain-containing protein YfiP
VTPLATRTRVVVLQHPRERDKAVGTARIAGLCLPNSEIFVGVDFAANARLARLLSDSTRPAIVLYPGPEARDLCAEPPPGPVTLVTIDGTWHQARTLMRDNPALARLPRYAFAPERPSEYQIRREPRPDYVSTIEALSVALGALEGDPDRFRALLAPFRAMVAMQLEFAGRSVRGRRRERRRNEQTARARLPDALHAPQLLCVTGEANAWPHDRALRRPPHPHELVHWLAQRVGDSERDDSFELLLAPRLPLAKSPIVHARLSEYELMQGAPLSALHTNWPAFVARQDVLVCWGPYALNLLRREGISLPEQVIDLRKVAGDYLKCRPGSLEELVAERTLSYAPCGRGRGGDRLGMLVAATRWLREEARAAV